MRYGLLTIAFAIVCLGWGDGASSAADPAAERGYRNLTEVAFLPPDFSDEVFSNVWQTWPAELRAKAAKASPADRRQMSLERYGLTPLPGDDSGKPLQYVVADDGAWSMNCFACHGGSVYGQATPGAPNRRFALQTMTEETRATKFKLGMSLSRMDMGAYVIPLGTTNGTTNAVVFGQGLMSRRDEQLNLVSKAPVTFTHHDMDAPPWWYFYKRSHLYIDGFAETGHRGLMQFMMVPENGPDFFRDHEDDFRDVFAYLKSLRPPAYQGPVDADLAEQGRAVFSDSCAECHGTHGENWTYPNRRVPIDEIGTDPVRLTALEVSGREKYGRSWFAHAGEQGQQVTVADPGGYVAPPLDGIWASAPYFHNGSVPTLWGVLNPSDRPAVWRPVSESLNSELMGLDVEQTDRVSLAEPDPAVRRSYFDTRRSGKSNQGHVYPDALSDQEKRAVLEYLKTL